jgi:transcriptional regulator with XRE-family HTH domain
MNKTIYSRQSEQLCRAIVLMRKKAGLTQRELASKLGREHNFVGRLELGERRLDVVEFFWLCRDCRADPVKESAKLMRQFEAVQSEKASHQ